MWYLTVNKKLKYANIWIVYQLVHGQLAIVDCSSIDSFIG